MAVIGSAISEDGEHHGDGRPRGIPDQLQDNIPKTLPYDLALRITKDGNMPQIQFNEDGEWHSFARLCTGLNEDGEKQFAPEGGVGLKAGPWFPFLELCGDERLSDHRVNRPRPVKGAGMNKSLAPSTAPASDGAGAAEEGAA